MEKNNIDLVFPILEKEREEDYKTYKDFEESKE